MNEQQRDLTGAWALDALSDDERALVEEFLAQDPEAAAEARSFEETAGELARGLEPEDPRPELKSSLMERISRTPQAPAAAPQDDDAAVDAAGDDPAGNDTADDDASAAEPTRHRTEATRAEPDAEVVPLDRYRSSVRRTRWLAVAAAALMVTSVVGVGLWNSGRAAQDRDRATIAALQSQQAAADEEREMLSTLMTAEDTTRVTVPADTGGTLHVMYSREQQAMMVQPSGLPELPSDSTYQLWIIDDAATDAGTITGPGQTVMAHEEMPPEASIGLTIEPAGGSEQPTSDPIALGELS